APPESGDQARYRRYGMRRYMGMGQSITESRIDERIAEYARRPEVSGQNENGPLAEQRTAGRGEPDLLDALIAENLQRHFHNEFQYTLDLTDTSRDRDTDPIVAFLYDYRRGHCEYFAGAMTLLC